MGQARGLKFAAHYCVMNGAGTLSFASTLVSTPELVVQNVARGSTSLETAGSRESAESMESLLALAKLQAKALEDHQVSLQQHTHTHTHTHTLTIVSKASLVPYTPCQLDCNVLADGNTCGSHAAMRTETWASVHLLTCSGLQAEADKRAVQLASQAEAHAALQQQVQQQAAVIATLQNQVACVTQQAGAPANISQQAAATPGETEAETDPNLMANDDDDRGSEAETNPNHRADDHALDERGSAQQIAPDRRHGEQGGVAWRTRWFTVRWSGGPHRFL